jgi:MFS-type transporter involved in bile tolerance (Atg22 family)
MRFFFAASSGTLGYFLYGFMEPILAFRVKEFHLDQVNIGLFFIIMPIFYIPTSILVQHVPNGIEKRSILIFSSFLAFFANLCAGPSQIFDLPDTVWMMGIG